MKQRVEHKEHISHLKKHRNVLYGIVMLLLILQIVSFVTISSQISQQRSQLGVMEGELSDNISDLENEVALARQESQFNINAITHELAQQKQDIEVEISLLKAGQADFSDVIDDVVVGVVSILTDRSAGSGFIVTSDGYLVTNFHVIDGSNLINVNAFDGNTYRAEVIGSDEFNDLAILKIEGSFNELKLGNSDKIQVGEKVIAIGNPLGLSFTVTEGIISAVNREGPNGQKSYIQISNSLNPGNSGGPLINKEGKVIGINNFKIGDAEGLGFALESNVVKEKVNEIIESVVV